MRRALCLLCVLWLPTAGAADFLPAEPQVLDAIDALPGVQAALAREREAMARETALTRSPYGYDLAIGPTVRHESRGGTYGEWEASVSRRVRLPRKAAIDRALGEVGRDAAQLALADARHGGALALLDSWFSWLRAAGARELAAQQLATARLERERVARRVQAGDLALLDDERASAALAQAEAALARSEFVLGRAATALATQFPALVPSGSLPEVPLPSVDDALATQTLVDGMVNDNHEIALAEASARQQGLAAARADAERYPDPSVGLRVIDEARGQEQAVGLVLNIPFAGPSASATALAEQQRAEALAADALTVRNAIASEARQLAGGIAAQLASWRAAERARAAGEAAYTRMEKAHALGEASVADVALARRNAEDARAAEWQARLDVHETQVRIAVNSHQLWARHDAHDH